MKRITQKLLSLGLAASMLLTLEGVQVYADVIPDTMPLTGSADETGGLYTGEMYDMKGNLIEFDLMPAEPVDELYVSPSGASANDSYFNLYDENRINKTVEDQGASETCWAHATLSSAESSMITQGLASTSINYSESHLVWFSQGVGPSNKSDPMYGDCCLSYGTDAYLYPAAIWLPMGTLARGSGVQLEANANHEYIYFRNAVPESQRYASYGLLKDSLVYDTSDIASIKNALVKHGACLLGFYSSSSYLNPETGAYFSNGVGGGHGVTLIGWDDNYSRLNFNADCRPTSDGAWIIKNSYGTSYANDGYMYISYEEVITSIASFIMTEADTYTNIYQHDGGIGMAVTDDGKLYLNRTTISDLTAANVFTANDNCPLTAVSFYTSGANVDYTISIIRGMTNADPTSGTIVHTQSGKHTYAGYHTVDLSKEVPLTKGEKFAVAVTMDTHCFDAYSKAETNTLCSIGVPSSSSTWYTIYDALEVNVNACIKAFTGAAPVAAPAFTDVETTGSSVKLTWSAVSNATSYRLYRADTKTGSKKLLKTVGNTYTTDTTVKSGSKYYYFVTAYNSTTGKVSPYSASEYVTALPAPAISSISGNDTSVTLKWNTISGATSYRIYRADSATGSKTLLKTVGNTYTTDSTVAKGKTYYYFVAAYDSSTGTESVCSAGKSVKAAFVSAPTITGVETTGSSVKLTWNAVSNATSYRVYRADSATGTKTLLKTVGNTYTTDTTAVAGKTYYYFVAAYDSSTTTVSAYSAGKYVTVLSVPVISSAVSASDTSISLKWNAITGATSYRVYRADSATGTKVLLKTVGNTYTTDTTPATARLYYYYVVAYSSKSATASAYSAGKPAVAGTISGLTTPVIHTMNVSGTNVTLKWNSVANATSYRIYRADSLTGTKKLLKTISNTFTTDYTPVAGNSYYYFVQAFNSPCAVGSAYSAPKCTTMFTKPVISSVSAAGLATIRIYWDEVSQATSYRLYRSTSLTGEKTLIKTVGNTFTSDTTVTPGVTYYYFIAAYNSATATLSGYSSAKAGVIMRTPEITSATIGGYDDPYIKVTGSVVSGATHYYLYRSDEADGTKTLVATSETTTMTDTTVVPGNNYFYFVAAYNKISDSISEYSNAEFYTSIEGIDPFSISMTETAKTAARITWSECEGATAYKLYRQNVSYGDMVYLGTCYTNSYYESNLLRGSTFYYYVQPINEDTGTDGELVQSFSQLTFTGYGYLYQSPAADEIVYGKAETQSYAA